MITKKHIEEFLRVAHLLGDEKFTYCSSGNISWRIGDEVLISGTGSWVPKLTEDKVAILDINTGESKNGVKPSMESGFHLGILRARPDCDVVMHYQAEASASVASMTPPPSNFNVIAEIACHIGSEIPYVPYYRPGSKELANGTTEALKEHNLTLLTNHGVVLCAKDFEHGYEMASFFELACKIIINSRGAYSTLTQQDIDDLDQYVLGKITK